MNRSSAYVLTAILALVGLTYTVVSVNRSRNTTEVKTMAFSTTTSQGITKVGAISGPWPECLGMECFNCLNYIRSFTDSDNGEQSIRIDVLKPGDPVTRDYRPDRVRIFCDKDGFVSQIPRRG